MNESDFLAAQFQANGVHLRAVAYRMLGSLSEAEDALQESWLRLNRTDADEIENLTAWLTTVVARICLNMLRSRKTRREDPLEVLVPEPVLRSPSRSSPTGSDSVDPEQQALLADSVGLALLVVLESLAPAERLAFVLHDMFAMPFEEIAPIVDRSPAATRQLASRARRRVQGAPVPETDLTRQRVVVDAFLAASRGGGFEALVAILDPDVLLRVDYGPDGPEPSHIVRGAETVARRALTFSRFAPFAQPVLVNGSAGYITAPDGKLFSVLAFTISGGRIVEIDILADPKRLEKIDLTLLDT